MTSVRQHAHRLLRHPDAAGAGGVIVVTALALTVVLRLWRADLGVPFEAGHDANVSLMVVKNVLSEGWYTGTDLLGAPFGMVMHDWPIHVGDWLSLGMVRALGLFTSSPAVALNLFYVATYFLVALSAYAALRLLERSRLVAIAAAVLYAFLPYHHLRGEQHVFLSAYWMVPLACVVLLRRLNEAQTEDGAPRPTVFEVLVVIGVAGRASTTRSSLWPSSPRSASPAPSLDGRLAR